MLPGRYSIILDRAVDSARDGQEDSADQLFNDANNLAHGEAYAAVRADCFREIGAALAVVGRLDAALRAFELSREAIRNSDIYEVYSLAWALSRTEEKLGLVELASSDMGLVEAFAHYRTYGVH